MDGRGIGDAIGVLFWALLACLPFGVIGFCWCVYQLCHHLRFGWVP